MRARDRLRARWRSTTPATWLYAPASDDRKAGKLDQCGAEAIILDLEDSVPVDHKPSARIKARDLLAGLGEWSLRCVRVYALDTCHARDDLQAIVVPALDCLVLPKVQASDDLWHVDRLLTAAEAQVGLPAGHITLLALIETAKGIARIDDILANAPDRLLTVAFGHVDFRLDMGIDQTESGMELDYPRARLCVAARAAGLAPAVDGPWLRISDVLGLRQDSVRSKAFGFAGRQVIHPAHVAPASQAYLDLSEERLGKCQRIVAAFEQAVALGSAAVQVDGELVDYPIYHRAQRLLSAIELQRATREPIT